MTPQEHAHEARTLLVLARAENAAADAHEARAATAGSPAARNAHRQTARRHRQEALRNLENARAHTYAATTGTHPTPPQTPTQ